MRISRKRIANNDICIYILIIFLIYPKFVDYSDTYVFIRKLIDLIPYVLLFVVLLFWSTNKRAKNIYFTIILFRMCYLISNVVNGAEINTHIIWAKQSIWILASAVSVCSIMYYNEEGFLRCLRNYLLFMTLINLLFQFILPQGISRMTMGSNNQIYWNDSIGFIDADNRLSLVYILFIYVDLIYKHLYLKKTKIKFFSIMLCMLSMIVAWSGSGLVAVSLIAIYALFMDVKFIQKIVSGYWVFLVYALFIMVFVVLQQTDVISFIIVNILHKNLNLSNRISIWGFYLLLIINQVFVGYGTSTGGVYYTNWQGDWYAHNQLLDLLVQGGLLVTIVFAYLIIRYKQLINKSPDKYITGLSSMCLLAYLVMGIVEHFLVNNNMCFFIFISVGVGVTLNRNNYLRNVGLIRKARTR